MIKSLRNAEICFDCELWLSLVNCNYELPTPEKWYFRDENSKKWLRKLCFLNRTRIGLNFTPRDFREYNSVKTNKLIYIMLPFNVLDEISFHFGLKQTCSITTFLFYC